MKNGVGVLGGKAGGEGKRGLLVDILFGGEGPKPFRKGMVGRKYRG